MILCIKFPEGLTADTLCTYLHREIQVFTTLWGEAPSGMALSTADANRLAFALFKLSGMYTEVPGIRDMFADIPLIVDDYPCGVK